MPISRSLLFLLLVTACSSSATCVPGTTMACLCVGGLSGVQSCVAGGTYSACDCLPAGVDGGVSPDAGGSSPSCAAPLAMCGAACVDPSTDEANCGGCGDASHTCATGSFCVMGVCQDVGACPPPFVMCDADCIDPGTNPAHCGASAACSGSAAGSVCGGACSSGRCVWGSCTEALLDGGSTGDGLYLVDIDGAGPIPPRDAYCDMTTDRGGWTLMYKIRNDVADIADPWLGMVDLGSGDALPTTITPVASGAHFEGPTREARYALGFQALYHFAEVRATMVSTTGAVILDVRTSDWSEGIGLMALGSPGTPTGHNCGPSAPPQARVIAAGTSSAFTAGDMVQECLDLGGSDSGTIRNVAVTASQPIFGDTSIGAPYVGTTTLFWLRNIPPA